MLQIIKSKISKTYNWYINRKANRSGGWRLFYSNKLKLKLLLNLDYLVDFLIFQKGVFEEEILLSIDSFKDKGKFQFVDIGSHLGQFSLYVKKKYPLSDVVSFEPHAPTYQQQKINMMINQIDYRLYDLALSDFQGNCALYLPPNSYRDVYGKKNPAMASLLSNNVPASGSAWVKCSTLDASLVNERHPNCMIVKMDVEGAEAQVLKGGKEFLHSSDEIYIIIELLYRDFPKRATEADTILREWGYVPCNRFWMEAEPKRVKNGNFFYKRVIARSDRVNR